MKREMVCLAVSGLMLGGVAQAAWAVEQGGQDTEHKTAPASSTPASAMPASAMPASAAPASVSSMPATIPPAQPAPTAVMQPAEVAGSIAMLDLKSATPTVKLSGANGKAWTFALDSKNTLVWKEGRLAKLDDLKQGQSVKIRHATIGGKDLAQSIRIASAAKPVASTTAPKTQSY